MAFKLKARFLLRNGLFAFLIFILAQKSDKSSVPVSDR